MCSFCKTKWRIQWIVRASSHAYQRSRLSYSVKWNVEPIRFFSFRRWFEIIQNGSGSKRTYEFVDFRFARTWNECRGEKSHQKHSWLEKRDECKKRKDDEHRKVNQRLRNLASFDSSKCSFYNHPLNLPPYCSDSHEKSTFVPEKNYQKQWCLSSSRSSLSY